MSIFMDLKAGYKLTEVGIIPEDWEVRKLGEFLEFKNGLNKGKEFFGYGNPIINYTDVYHNSGIYKSDVKGRVSLTSDEIRRFQVKAGDVFFTRTSETPEEVGFSAVLLEDIKNCSFSGFILRGRPKNEMLVKEYCAYCFLSKDFREKVVNSCTYTTRALTNGKVLSNISIPIPPIHEQKKIAKAFEDIDMIISSLAIAISKKKQIKEGTIQQLLTGKKRLPGFDGKWIEKSIGELGLLTSAGVDKLSLENEQPVRLVNYVDVFHRDYIYNNELDFWVTASDKKIEKCNVLKGDVFFTPSSEMPYDIALSAVAMEDMPGVCYSYHIYRFRFTEPFDLKYKAYMFKCSDFYSQAQTLCEGSGKRYVISMPKFRSMIVKYPPTIDEQMAIANILSDIDEEIHTLEAEQEKYHLIKQGMMQDLLTGKIRLK